MYPRFFNRFTSAWVLTRYLRANSRRKPTPAFPGRRGIEWRLDAAGRSACATISTAKLFLRGAVADLGETVPSDRSLTVAPPTRSHRFRKGYRAASVSERRHSPKTLTHLPPCEGKLPSATMAAVETTETSRIRALWKRYKEISREVNRGFIGEWTVTIILLLFATTTLVQAFVIPSARTIHPSQVRFTFELPPYGARSFAP